MPAAQPKSQFGKGLRSGMEQVSSIASGVEATGQALVGDNEAADAAVMESQRFQEEAQTVTLLRQETRTRFQTLPASERRMPHIRRDNQDRKLQANVMIHLYSRIELVGISCPAQLE